MAVEWFSIYVQSMKTNQFSPNANQTTAKAQKPIARADLTQSKPGSTPSPEAVARRAYAIYENQGSQPGHEVKPWLEAEGQLLGGVEHESQMHPGSSFFATER
jgi:hypothetical protein